MHQPSKSEHIPVLLKESIEGLKVKEHKKYIDATLGDGGHALKILKKGGKLLAIDRDPDQVRRATRKFKKVYSALRLSLNGHDLKKPFTLVVGNFKDLAKIASEHGFESPAGILFDLGVSSAQLEDPRKGLSFTLDAPLDMRLDPTLRLTARDLVNQLSEGELYEIFTRNAQEELARPIAEAIVSARSLKPIETTTELAEIARSIAKSRGRRSKLHPATKTFLALRIEVNSEIENLKKGLVQAIEILKTDGRLVVISFHETEDRLVKKTMQKAASHKKLKIISKKPITPSVNEIESNPKARSAKLRIGERL